MACVLRFGILRALSKPAAGTKTLLAKTTVPAISQSCTITGKSFRGKPLERPKPYPYKTKNYNVWHSIFDKTTQRFDENSKIIVVDGPMAAGKGEFAKSLAEELEMLFIPEPTMDFYYINQYGYDLRQLDSHPNMPPNCRSFENKHFLQDPHSRQVASFQIKMLVARYDNYIDALAHLMSTGQGVVLERSVYSDFVFMETMYRAGYISPGARAYYNKSAWQAMPELMKPHLVIYLDVPVPEVKNRIKKRNLDYEVNSKVLTDEYLKTFEYIYKQQYLKDISTHAELLVYDWSNYGEAEVVVEDIERIDFDRFRKEDSKLKDWRMWHEEDWCAARMMYSSDKAYLMNHFNVPELNVPEILWTSEEHDAWNELWFSAPGMQYSLGYNEDMGDKDLLLKTKLELRNGH